MARPKNATSNGPPTKADLAHLDTIRLSVEKIDLNADQIRKYIAKGASATDLFLYMGTARSLGLNPLLGEIHWIPFKDGGNVVVGYQVYLKRAEATGQLDGWAIDYGKDSLGEYCQITIHRKDRAHPFEWKTYRHEVDTGSPIWKKRGHFMHAKCTIAQGMRLCFPAEVGSLPYIMEEIVGEPEEPPTQQPALPAETPTIQVQEAEYVEDRDPGQPIQQEEQSRDGMAEHRKAYHATVNGVFKTDDERRAWQEKVTGKTSTQDWIAADYTKAFDALNAALQLSPTLVTETETIVPIHAQQEEPYKNKNEIAEESDSIDALISRVARKINVDDAAFGGWVASKAGYDDIDEAFKELQRALEHEKIAEALLKRYQESIVPKRIEKESEAKGNDLFEGGQTHGNDSGNAQC